MPSEILVPLADRIVAIGEAIDGVEVKAAYRWPRRELNNYPALVVELPGVERTGVDQPEDHLGQKDWKVTFPVAVYVELVKAPDSMDKAAELIEAFVLAIDADHSLGGLCQEAKAVEVAPPIYTDDEPRPFIHTVISVEVLTFV